MLLISSCESAFRFTPPRLRLRVAWLAPALVAVAIVLGLAVGTSQRAPSPAAHAAPAAAAPLSYVSSDPSVPPADSVKFPDPEPHIEAF